jgi:hypothetical protein
LTTLYLVNANTSAVTTKPVTMSFRLTDTAGTRKNAFQLTAYADSAGGNIENGGLIFSGRKADVDTEYARIDSSGNFLVGATSTSGTVGNYATVLGGLFRSFSGSVSAATNTYVTLFGASGGTISSYLVSVWVSADDVVNYQANVIVNTQGGSSTKVTTIVGGSLLLFQMSGYNFQAAQLSGGTATINYSAIRIGAA